jgi:hypothetical protein
MSTNHVEAVRIIALRCVTEAKARGAIEARCIELHAAGVRIGDARVCELAQAFLKVFNGEGLKRQTATNYLSAVRRSVNDGAPFCLNPYQNKPTVTDAADGAEEGAEDKGGKKERAEMSAAERARRLVNAKDFDAFAAIMRRVAEENPGLPIDAVLKACATGNK